MQQVAYGIGGALVGAGGALAFAWCYAGALSIVLPVTGYTGGLTGWEAWWHAQPLGWSLAVGLTAGVRATTPRSGRSHRLAVAGTVTIIAGLVIQIALAGFGWYADYPGDDFLRALIAWTPVLVAATALARGDWPVLVRTYPWLALDRHRQRVAAALVAGGLCGVAAGGIMGNLYFKAEPYAVALLRLFPADAASGNWGFDHGARPWWTYPAVGAGLGLGMTLARLRAGRVTYAAAVLLVVAGLCADAYGSWRAAGYDEHAARAWLLAWRWLPVACYLGVFGAWLGMSGAGRRPMAWPTVVAALCVPGAVIAAATLADRLNRSRFDAQAWAASDTTSPRRLYMVGDLVARERLTGMTRAQVVALLGRDDAGLLLRLKHYDAPAERTLIYLVAWLGICSPLSDSRALVIRLAPDGRVERSTLEWGLAGLRARMSGTCGY
jgi:hypothetical protein